MRRGWHQGCSWNLKHLLSGQNREGVEMVRGGGTRYWGWYRNVMEKRKSPIWGGWRPNVYEQVIQNFPCHYLKWTSAVNDGKPLVLEFWFLPNTFLILSFTFILLQANEQVTNRHLAYWGKSKSYLGNFFITYTMKSDWAQCQKINTYTWFVLAVFPVLEACRVSGSNSSASFRI